MPFMDIFHRFVKFLKINISSEFLSKWKRYAAVPSLVSTRWSYAATNCVCKVCCFVPDSLSQGRGFDYYQWHLSGNNLEQVVLHPMCFSYQAVHFSTGQRAVMFCGWEGNRRPGDSNGSLSLGLWLVTCRLFVKDLDQLRHPEARPTSMGSCLPFLQFPHVSCSNVTLTWTMQCVLWNLYQSYLNSEHCLVLSRIKQYYCSLHSHVLEFVLFVLFASLKWCSARYGDGFWAKLSAVISPELWTSWEISSHSGRHYSPLLTKWEEIQITKHHFSDCD